VTVRVEEEEEEGSMEKLKNKIRRQNFSNNYISCHSKEETDINV